MEMGGVFLFKIKLISLTTVEQQDSLRNQDKQQLGNGPFQQRAYASDVFEPRTEPGSEDFAYQDMSPQKFQTNNLF